MMKTYWDLSDPERAKLSSEDVERFADAELMVKGVLKPRPPVLADETAPTIQKPTFYAVGFHGRYGAATSDLAFADLSDAETAATRAVAIDDDYEIGLKVAKTVLRDPIPVQAITESQAVAHRSALLRARAAKEANQKERDRFEHESEKAKVALQGMWDNWHGCLEADRHMRRIVETFEAYVLTADGSRRTAAKFLSKVFSADAIRDASEWCGVDIPLETASAESTAPARS